ncbi:GNAT family N-acetyltransferase [bacterium]|nr:GNAT family N-acetyltransferase [bacterium]
MSGQEIIRLATHADIPAMAGLLGILFSREGEFTPALDRQVAGLTAILDDPAIGSPLVAERDGVMVGMVSLLYTISTALGGRAVVMEDMIVHPDHRGDGLGTRLLDAAIAHAKATVCLRITLLTDVTNVGAQRLYERRGFVKSVMLPMRLKL